MNWKKSVILKKAIRHGFDALRPIVGPFSNGPIVLANSFPKSGTHLLVQILAAFNLNDYGNFLASTPSLTMREISPAKMSNKLNRLIAGELASAHMFHSEQVATSIENKNITHFFIYRDPRDVVLSECFYLSEMNRWHKLHGYFNKFDDISSKISASIHGVDSGDFYYPDIGTRMSRYSDWINNDQVMAIRFEDLVGDKQRDTILNIVNFYYTKNDIDPGDIELLADNAIELIAPEKSHTFRSGKVGKWREHFSEEQIQQFQSLAEKQLSLWGYD